LDISAWNGIGLKEFILTQKTISYTA